MTVTEIPVRGSLRWDEAYRVGDDIVYRDGDEWRIWQNMKHRFNSKEEAIKHLEDKYECND